MWLGKVSSLEHGNAMTSQSESDEELASSEDGEESDWYYEGARTHSEHMPAYSRQEHPPQDFHFDDYYGDFERMLQMDQLREEFPDMDSDALEDVWQDRLQDFDETGSNYSHGS